MRHAHGLLLSAGQAPGPLERTLSSFIGIFPFFAVFAIRSCHIFRNFASIPKRQKYEKIRRITMNKRVLLMILDGWGEGRHDYS
ncbi:MAG: hypothetical protein IJ636_02380, partial [Bacteroidales bacterium]|nr:hypothetical protein [Bacteroidales bacterium]